jgi:hypothetical protein
VLIKNLIMNRQAGYIFIALAIIAATFNSCSKDDATDHHGMDHKLIFKFVFDSTQVRLDAFGNPSTVPSNHGAQSPRFNKMSAHYIEMAPGAFTALGAGEILYHHDETTAGGASAIDFVKSNPVGNNEVFFSIPFSEVTPGTYEYLRVSLAYQNYDINVRANVSGTNYDFIGTIASFIGFNTYITDLTIKDSTIQVNSNKLQGFWAFESQYGVSQGLAAGTTVPNPIFATSPIPAGSCVVTAAFATPLVIPAEPTADVVITVSLSTNNSFEWIENSTPGYYEPLAGDQVVDMGIRGMVLE